MTLAAAYLGFAYYFVQAVRAPRWGSFKAGVPAVTVFITLLGTATVLHWDRFNYAHPALWLRTSPYARAPFLAPGLGWPTDATPPREPSTKGASG